MLDFIFATFLFVVYFSFYCWLFTPQSQQPLEQAQDRHETDSKDALQALEKTLQETPKELPQKALDRHETGIKEAPQKPQQQKQQIDLSELKFYKLHGQSVILVSALPDWFELPDYIQKYKLRGNDTVKLKDLEQLIK